MDAEDYYESGIMIGLMVAGIMILQLCTTFIEAPYGSYIGMILYFTLSVGGIFLVTIATQLAAAPHPYIKMIVRPENKELHVFVDTDMSYDRYLGGDLYEAHFKTAIPIKYKDYGKIREVIILHKGKFKDRTYFRPGTAIWKGISVKHSTTEIIEVKQAKTTTTTIDHGEPLPVFQLIMGSKDRESSKETFTIGNEEYQILKSRLEELESENAKLRRDAIEYQQRALALEEINIQKTAETAGLLEAKVGIKEHAYETFLGLLNAFGRFDKAVEALGGKKISADIIKWIVLGAIGVIFIAYLWANPQVVESLTVWLSVPFNAFIVMIIVVAIAVAVYYYTRGKKKR